MEGKRKERGSGCCPFEYTEKLEMLTELSSMAATEDSGESHFSGEAGLEFQKKRVDKFNRKQEMETQEHRQTLVFGCEEE